MPRALISAVAVLLVVAWTTTAVLTSSGKDDHGGFRHYVIELDNAFGLTTGSDVKIGGVAAGSIESLSLDQRTLHALVGIRLTVKGFDSLRRDAFCEARPQSLIGEYSLACQPGTGQPLPVGGRLPVSRTGSAIGLDLLNTALRRPYNERLRILLGELGAGVAARGEDINTALRRAVPALRETNRVLGVLAHENRTLADLATNGDRALAGLDRRRADVVRFVKAAGRSADISAQRRDALAAQFDRFPGFLAQVPPAMDALGSAADGQAAALRTLGGQAPQLQTFFRRLGAFSAASRPAVAALGRAATTGITTARHARAPLAELARATAGLPELSNNLAIVGEHLDDRRNAVEPDGRSPGGKGFTGLEALLQYIFNQSTSINVFDGTGYLLKVDLLNGGACGRYADVAAARAHPECSGAIGPTQPGVTTPDPTAGGQQARSAHKAQPRRARHLHHRRRHHRHRHAGQRDATPSPSPTAVPTIPAVPGLPPLPQLPQLPTAPTTKDAGAVLDYLLGP